MSDNYFRLVTRSDFDGLVCAVLLKELDMIDDTKFVHLKDMQDGTILISDTNITTNPPYVEGVRFAFDLPDVKEQIKRCTTAHGNLAVLDLRDEETIYAGNRFMIYALLPDTNISIHVLWGLNKLNTVFATGKSIINRTSKTNIGDLMLKYGGGGHESAGTCQIKNDDAERVLSELIEQITADG